MSKTVWKFCFDFLEGQEKWLNRMAENGWRLMGCARASYTFEPAEPGAYEYAVVYMADENRDRARDYARYLEARSLRAFRKNIKFNFSSGKTRWHPYAQDAQEMLPQAGEPGNELLILERESGGEAFSLTMSPADRAHAYRSAGISYLWALVLSLVPIFATFLPTARALYAPVMWVLRAVLAAFMLFYAALGVFYIALSRRN